MVCRFCDTSDRIRIVWDARNIVVPIVNALYALIQLSLVVYISPGLGLRRRCLRCGRTFIGPAPNTPDFDKCATCGYNLRGNTSGTCPECGWELPRRYRAYRRRADADLR